MKFFVFLFLLPTFALAIGVDEKLTVRVIKTTESKKTLLVNRGIEDGIAEGDHAKFIVTAGVVARAVCVQVSPTRSIWSVYRLVNADLIVNDTVMTLKGVPAVKITKDESKAIVQEDTPDRTSGSPEELGIPLAEGAMDQGTTSEASSADLKALEDHEPATNVEKNIELFSFLNLSMLSSNTKNDSGAKSYNSSQQNSHLGLGGEYYFRKEREWYSSLSLLGSVAQLQQNNQTYNGSTSKNSLTEFSLGLNWHPTKLPSAVYSFIPFINLSTYLGTISSTYTPGSENNGGTSYSGKGSTNAYSVGFGYKFYTDKGFGVRAILDYYVRAEKYKADTIAQDTFSKKVAGPRFMMGISYRF
ncbi:MAG: hypothetical protein AB7I27_11450 [Bacteriovoracaceae bacterium]